MSQRAKKREKASRRPVRCTAKTRLGRRGEKLIACVKLGIVFYIKTPSQTHSQTHTQTPSQTGFTKPIVKLILTRLVFFPHQMVFLKKSPQFFFEGSENTQRPVVVRR